MVDGHGASDAEMFVRYASEDSQMNQTLPTIHARIRQTTVVEDSDSETDTAATPREKHAVKKLDQQISQQNWLTFITDADMAAAQMADAGLAKHCTGCLS